VIITKLIVSNVKGVKAIRIEPDGNMVVLSGRNGQGKTSVLDSIWLAISGAAAAKSSPSPLRHGEQSGYVEVHLGELVVRRTWSAGKTTKLTVKSGGVAQRSPQKLLDELIGALSFDPLAFDRLSGSAQRAMLLGLVELGFDPDELEARRLETFNRRTEVNRDVKRLEAQLAGLPAFVEDVPGEPVCVSDLLGTLERAQKVEAHVKRLERAARDAAAAVVAAKEWLVKAERVQREADQAYAALPEPRHDPAEIMERISNADAINLNVRNNKAWTQANLLATDARANALALTEQLSAIDAEKTDGLAKAQMPIEGLGFTADGVTYLGSPLEQVSGAERWRICVAIAMALNPTLKVLRITEGSLLDATSRALLEETVTQHGFQAWLEVVADEDGEGFQIEDGELVEVQAS